MTEPLPDPPIPASVDLRDFPYMPLDVARLRDSDLAALETAEAFRAAVLLWAAAWHQVPAGSLPDDDRVLSKLAGFGRVVAEWRKVKSGALRGFVECSDGRLYHEVVAEKALDGWRSRLLHRWTTDKAAEKKRASRAKREPVYPSFSLWITTNCPEATPYLSQWTRDHVPEDTPPPSPGHPPHVPPEKASKGSEGKLDSKNHRGNGGSIASAPPPAGGSDQPLTPDASARIIAECARAKLEDPTEANPIIARWIQRGAVASQVATALAEARRYKPGPEPLEARYVSPIVERLIDTDRKAREAADERVRRTLADNEALRKAADAAVPRPAHVTIPRKAAA